MTISLFVAGVPAPQGSAKGFVVGKRAIITHDNPRTKPWRSQLTEALAARETMFTGAVSVYLLFVMPRTKSLPKTTARPHTTRPDIDKLERACLDAMTGIVIGDDSQVTDLHASKRYAAIGEQSGVHIRIAEAS